MSEDAQAGDAVFMARALALAERGLYTTTPNPRVGCVLVRGGEIVGEGWHERAGEAHAEVRALVQAGERARGATAYVTLEPCSHFGRTPPCAGALLTAGVSRVVCAMQDPNPLVSGRGLTRLEGSGVTVSRGLMEEEARDLNLGFVSRMERGRPWVRLKMAASLDGRTAAADGSSQWITAAAARRDGHHWRARACAVLTGSGTVLADDPRLDVREVSSPRQPLRIVLDSRGRLAARHRIFAQGAVLLMRAAGKGEAMPPWVEVVDLTDATGRSDLTRLLALLAAREINELHVEAGPELSGAFIEQGLADELLIYYAPKLLGDAGRGMFHLPGLLGIGDAMPLKLVELARLGDDLRLRTRFTPPTHCA